METTALYTLKEGTQYPVNKKIDLVMSRNKFKGPADYIYVEKSPEGLRRGRSKRNDWSTWNTPESNATKARIIDSIQMADGVGLCEESMSNVKSTNIHKSEKVEVFDRTNHRRFRKSKHNKSCLSHLQSSEDLVSLYNAEGESKNYNQAKQLNDKEESENILKLESPYQHYSLNKVIPLF